MRRVTPLYVAGLALFLLSFIWSWAALPPVVASHFDSNGNAYGWMDHTSYLVFMACVGVLALVIVPGLGVLAARHPGRYLSIPNRRYWLRPENRARFRRQYTTLNMAVGAAIALLIGAVNLAVLYANTTPPAHLASGGLLVVLFIATAVGLALIHRHFRRPE